MFDGWGNYYVLLGSGAAALIGVMALVATLTSSSGDPSRALRGQRLFLTPIVFHLAAVLSLSAVALAPHMAEKLQLALMGALTLYGLGFAVVISVQIALPDTQTSHWSDFWCYGVTPAVGYVALAGAIAAAWAGFDAGGRAIGLCILVLILSAIRNAWDLVTWLAPRRPSGAASDTQET